MLIGELAKASDTTKDTIRHYDELGLLLSSNRQAGSRVYKEFSADNLERLQKRIEEMNQVKNYLKLKIAKMKNNKQL